MILPVLCLATAFAQSPQQLLRTEMQQQRDLERRLAERQREQQRAGSESMRANRVHPLDPVPAQAVEISAAPAEQTYEPQSPAQQSVPTEPESKPARSPVPYVLTGACLLALLALFNLAKIAYQRLRLVPKAPECRSQT